MAFLFLGLSPLVGFLFFVQKGKVWKGFLRLVIFVLTWFLIHQGVEIFTDWDTIHATGLGFLVALLLTLPYRLLLLGLRRRRVDRQIRRQKRRKTKAEQDQVALKACRKEVADLLNENAALEKSLSHLQEKHDQSLQKENQLAEKLQEAKAQAKNWEQKAHHLEQKVGQAQTIHDQLKAETTVKSNEIDILSAQLEANDAERSELSESIDQLTTERDALSKQLDELLDDHSFHLEKIMEVFQRHRRNWDGHGSPQLQHPDEQRYAFLMAMAWAEVNRGRVKNPQVFRQKIEEMIRQKGWVHHFCEGKALDAIRWCRDHQWNRLPFAESVPFPQAENYPELYRNLLAFWEQGDTWKETHEFRLFQTGAHHHQEWFEEEFLKDGLATATISINEFFRLKAGLESIHSKSQVRISSRRKHR